MSVLDLFPDFVALVAAARSEDDFRARFDAWIEAQRRGALAGLLDDMTRLWSGVGSAPPLKAAWETVAQIAGRGMAERARAVLARHEAVTGHRSSSQVVLLAGLRRPEGYSRFDRGRNTVFIGLDHPASLRDEDHFEIVLAHELCHAVRDSAADVLRDYGGDSDMSHDDFVARHPLREHLVSEGLAGALSELAYPGRASWRYVYMTPEEHAWCETHRRRIAARMRHALEQDEPYRTFYQEGSAGPGSPSGCDYYFGFHLVRFALEREPASELLIRASTQILAAHLEPFLERFVEPAPAASRRPAAAPELEILPEDVQAFYRDWLQVMRAQPDASRTSEQQLARSIAGERLEHGGQPFEVQGFPIVLARDEEGYLRWVGEGLMRVAERVVELYRTDADVRAFFGLPLRTQDLVLAERRARPAIPIARFDAHWNGRRVRFLELNTNGTAALPLADRIGPLWLATPAGQSIAEQHRLRCEPLVQRLIDELDAIWRRAGRRAHRDGPRHIGILDWRGVPTRSEQELLREALAAAGHDAVLVDPTELAFERGALLANGRPVDQIYRRLTLEDFLAPDARLEPYLEAVRAGAVVDGGSFAADVAHTKRMFVFLTHERWRHAFTMEERALIDAHIPWSRMVEPGTTLRGDQPRDLREIARSEREQLVLKPAEGHEGRDVLLGIETTAAEWERELERRMGRGHILQEHVPAPVRTVFTPGASGLVDEPHFFHLGQYVFGGRAAGFLARVSPERVLSSRSNERAVPILVLAQ